MQATNPHASFTVTWAIPLAEYNKLDEKKLEKYFYPTLNNVVFRCRLELTAIQTTAVNRSVRYRVIYEDGPISELKEVTFLIETWKPDCTTCQIGRLRPKMLKRGTTLHYVTYLNDNCSDTIELDPSFDSIKETVYCMINVKIPRSVFNYRLDRKQFDLSATWLLSLYEDLVDAELSKYSDVQFVSGDRWKYYCHRVVISKQSNELATMLQNPQSEKERSGEFTFPKLNGEALDEIVKYLYTGVCFVGNLRTPSIIQLADFGEQYDLKDIKEECMAVLWQRVVEKPDHAIDILRFADLHDEKYLKDRALDVLQENFEKLSLQLDDFSKGNDGDLQGKRLQAEFNLFTLRRVPVVRFEQ